MRAGLALLVAVVGHQASNFAQYINVQGAILSNIIGVIVPCSLYMKAFKNSNKTEKACLKILMAISGIGGVCILWE